ncbi:hypothetical protein B296_00055725 [Ensete ventricosum]|uniref:Clp R domain-containing protein n=1 Tax=Ensete ventricosum TaxID=4639 RepID=A0A426XMM0_ENSVE|nr:hypothetical protein B296_00055725 [Ensete ventricosum]
MVRFEPVTPESTSSSKEANCSKQSPHALKSHLQRLPREIDRTPAGEENEGRDDRLNPLPPPNFHQDRLLPAAAVQPPRRPPLALSPRRLHLPRVVLALPEAEPPLRCRRLLASHSRASAEKRPKWSSMSIRAFGMAELEARKLKYPKTGTEALLMGILVEGEDGEITTAHMLLGIWSEKESAGYKILASLGFDDQKAGELAKSANKDVAMNSP